MMKILGFSLFMSGTRTAPVSSVRMPAWTTWTGSVLLHKGLLTSTIGTIRISPSITLIGFVNNVRSRCIASMALGCVCPVTGSNPHTRQLKEKRRLDGLFNPSTRLSVQSNQLIKNVKRYGRGECPDRHLLTFNGIVLTKLGFT